MRRRSSATPATAGAEPEARIRPTAQLLVEALQFYVVRLPPFENETEGSVPGRQLNSHGTTHRAAEVVDLVGLDTRSRAYGCECRGRGQVCHGLQPSRNGLQRGILRRRSQQRRPDRGYVLFAVQLCCRRLARTDLTTTLRSAKSLLQLIAISSCSILQTP